MNGSIFIDKDGNEVEVIKWGDYYIHFVYLGSRLASYTPKKKFLKEFEPKEEENEL